MARGSAMRTFILSTIFTFSILFSQNQKFGGGPNSFYQRLYSSREAGMGGVGVASANGYLGFLWNPANMVNAFDEETSIIAGILLPLGGNALEKHQLSSSWYAGAFNLRLTLSKIEKCVIGVGAISQSYEEVQHTNLNINDEIIFAGVKDYFETLIMPSFSFKKGRWSFGILGKYNINNIRLENNDLWGIDLGLLVKNKKETGKTKTGNNFTKFHDFGLSIKIDKELNNDDVRFGFGNNFSKVVFRNNKKNISRTYSYDLVTGQFTQPTFKFGFEYGHSIFIRFGGEVMTLIRPLSNSVGFGFAINKLNIDISYTFYLERDYEINYLLVDSPLKMSITWKN